MTSEDWLAAAYAQHRAGLRRYLARIVGAADADDLLHDVFERAQRSSRPDDGAEAPAWLYRIARNAAIDRQRGFAVRERDDVRDALVQGRPDEPQPDVELARAQMRSCILDLVDRLSPNHRAVLLLSELGGLSDQETADALELTLGAATIRLHRARRALREFMECECRTFRDERNELACEPVRAVALPVLS